MKNALALATVACMLMFSLSTLAVTPTPTNTPSLVAGNGTMPPNAPPASKQPGPNPCTVGPIVL
ncbi:MAG: hypothetical protein ABSG11_17800 [Candidatus Korobacteraceae bacterium]